LRSANTLLHRQLPSCPLAAATLPHERTHGDYLRLALARLRPCATHNYVPSLHLKPRPPSYTCLATLFEQSLSPSIRSALTSGRPSSAPFTTSSCFAPSPPKHMSDPSAMKRHNGFQTRGVAKESPSRRPSQWLLRCSKHFYALR